MRRRAARALVHHTKQSIEHLKDEEDEMLRGVSIFLLYPQMLVAAGPFAVQSSARINQYLVGCLMGS